jgi:hypothetical protein
VLALALIAQLAIVANGPDTATACLPVRLTAAIRTAGRDVPSIELPRAGGIQLLRSGVASRLDPGGAGTLTEIWADVAISPVGRFRVPPFVATVRGERVASAPLEIDVRDPIAPPPVVLVAARIEDPFGGAAPDSIFVGEQVDYTVEVLLNETARGRLRRNPTFFPPEMSAVLAYDVDLPRAPLRQVRRCFEALNYRRAIFPLFAGRIVIPPATLTYSLPLSASFFSREESFELHSDSVQFVAVDPPARGRPIDYAGAVGTMHIAASVESVTARVGDPLVITARVTGVGNVKLLPRPMLELPWARLTTGDERVDVDTSASRVSGTKEFDWIATPREPGTQVVPPFRYPYFDPVLRRYAVAEASPIPLVVAPGSLAPADTVAGPRAPIRVVLRAGRGDPSTSHPLYWALLALAPVPAALRRLWRRGSVERAASPARRLRALVTASDAPTAREVRSHFVAALRDRIPAVARERAPLGRVLRRSGVSDATALEAESMLARLDDAAFSPSGSFDARLAREALDIVEAVDREALRTTALDARSMLLVAALGATLAASVALAQAPSREAQRLFADGVHAYRRAQFSIAERRFERVAREAPRSVDAWSNLATAAWEAGDTAIAARAWHHALRLDPLDDESRDRLSAVQALGPRSAGYVAPVAPDALAWVVLALWLGAWAALAIPAARRPAIARPIAGGAIALALAGLVALFELRSGLETRDLAVLVHGRALLEAPATDAPALATAGAGEAGRLGARDGAWVHLTVDAARAGWVPAIAVMPIDPVQPTRLTGLAPVR